MFVKGVPRKGEYRRFRIKTVHGANDFAMLQEVLRRRFRRAAAARQQLASSGQEGDGEEQGGWGVLPDLLIVDGGKGQLSAAREVMSELQVQDLPTIGLAKEREEVFVPARSAPIVLPRDSQALYLLQRVRDEAHRFAIGYHRQLRSQKGLSSNLDAVPGIGPKRRQALLKHFGSLEAVRQATVEQLASVAGMSHAAALKIKEHL